MHCIKYKSNQSIVRDKIAIPAAHGEITFLIAEAVVIHNRHFPRVLNFALGFNRVKFVLTNSSQNSQDSTTSGVRRFLNLPLNRGGMQGPQLVVLLLLCIG